MRKLPTLITTLLCCTSLALAQFDDEEVSSEESAPADAAAENTSESE